MVARSLALVLVVFVAQLAAADEVADGKLVAPQELARHRIAGQAHIEPSPATKKKIVADPNHPRFVMVSYKVCVDTSGSVSKAQLLHSGGYPEYDEEIRKAILGNWRFRPWEADGKLVAVCTANTQIFEP